MDRRLHPAEGILEGGAAAGERLTHVADRVQGEQVEGDQPGRGLGGQEPDPAGRGVDAQQQGVEVEPPARWVGDHDLGVDHTAGRELAAGRLNDLGEVAGHGPLLAAAQLDLVAVAEHDGAEPVPFGLEAPGPVGQRGDRPGQHRGHRRHHRKIHALQYLARGVCLVACLAYFSRLSTWDIAPLKEAFTT
jgi:hypothetical protein